MNQRWLTYDDVCLLPSYSTLNSRVEPTLETRFTRKTNISMPFIPSPMSSVISIDLGKRLFDKGVYPVFHRFYKDSSEINNWLHALAPNCYISWGLENLQELTKLLQDKPSGFQPKGVCLDVAHGHTQAMYEAITYIKFNHPKLEIIAGTICTPTAVSDLALWGADAIRVGIGGGSACTTRLVTGFGAPQFTALLECSRVARKHNVPIIADGGIRDSRDISLALAAGASSVMMGKLFAAVDESAAENYGEHHKIYKGQASSEFQKAGRASEGEQGLVKKIGSVDRFLEDLSLNLKTALSYGGAKNIEQFREKVQWVEVGAGYRAESNVRFDVNEGYLL